MFSPILALAMMANAATGAKPAAVEPKPQDKVICRKYPVIGSLTQVNKVCHTRAEWSKLQDEARHDTEKMQEMHSAASPVG